MYILDTNTLIYYFKGQGKVAQNLANVSPQEIGISAIVLFELQVGIAKSTSPAKRTQQLQQLLNRINLIPFDRNSAVAAATIRAQLEQQGTPMGPIDVLIAGTAASLKQLLLPTMSRSFREFQDLRSRTGIEDSETRFLGLGGSRGTQKRGFLPKSSIGCQNYRRNQISVSAK